MTETFTNAENEVIFSSHENILAENDEELVSDRVHILANNIYQEFETLIKKHGQGTVDGLMPLVVSMLETMDKLYTCKDELTLQIDLIKEDQSQLYTQYDREKTCRRLAEQKINRLEDQFEEEKRNLEDRIEFMESNNKLLDMRSRNCRDLITRLEEKEAEIRKDYSSLQQRYSELLKSKSDHINKHRGVNSHDGSQSGHHSPVSLSKIKLEKIGKEETISELLTLDKETYSTLMTVEPVEGKPINELSLKDEIGEDLRPDSNFQFEDSNVSNQELGFYINGDTFENFIGSGDNCNDDNDDEVSCEGEFDDLVMGKEIEFLIKENQDLVETKIALNVVKDDLITKLDEMTGEMCILREDLRTAITLKKEYKAQVQELEKVINELSENLKAKEQRLIELGEEENLIECSVSDNGVQTKTKFTRAEVSRILQERNKYKEELLELQESLRYQTSILDKGTQRSSKRGTIWNLFSNVLSNATAYTAEAFIGSGNEVTVGQLNRTFSNNRQICYVHDEDGSVLKLPNLVHKSSPQSQKKSTPGSVVRVTNPLLVSLNNDTNNRSSFDLVPVDSVQEIDSSL